MVTVIGVIILLMLLLIVYRKANNTYQQEKYIHQMFFLRDELRNLAFEKKVDANTREFHFLDFAISNSIKDSYYYNIYFIACLEQRHKGDVNQNLVKTLDAINENEYLKKIDKQRRKLFYLYIRDQNKITLFIFRPIFAFRDKYRKVINNLRNKIIRASNFPEVCG